MIYGGIKGLLTYGYHSGAERGRFGGNAPYIHPPEAAGLSAAVTMMFARAVWKNPFVVMAMGVSAFGALGFFGRENNIQREREWELYRTCARIPTREFLITEAQRVDLSSYRKETLQSLLKAHYSDK